MAKADKITANQAEAMMRYKEILRQVLDARPSGTRQRLATALGKNRSFISQIANLQYATPVPARHLDAIFEICHFSKEMRTQFMAAYSEAHPVRLAPNAGGMKLRRHTMLLPDMGDAKKNHKLDALVAEFVSKLVKIIND